MTITESTALGYDKIHQWPGLDILDRVKTIVRWWAGIGFSTLPAILLGMVMPKSIPLYLFLAPVLAYFFFPLVFLSMLDADSMAIPYSAVIWKSVRRYPRVWRPFYFAALPLFLTCAGGGVLLAVYLHNYVAIPLGVALVISSVIYARLLGRLGWSLDQVITPELLEEAQPVKGATIREKIPLDV